MVNIPEGLKNFKECELCEVLGIKRKCIQVNGEEYRDITEGSNKEPVRVPGSIRQCYARSKIGEVYYIATSLSIKVEKIREDEKMKKVPLDSALRIKRDPVRR